MDERIMKIIKAMASADTCYNDNSGVCECLFCRCTGSAKNWDVVEHDTDCPVLLAKAVLQDEGRVEAQ